MLAAVGRCADGLRARVPGAAEWSNRRSLHASGRCIERCFRHLSWKRRSLERINMKTAKALGIEIPISMQLLANEVIE